VNLLPFGKNTVRQQLLYPLKLSAGEMQRFSFLHFPAHMDAPAWSTKPYVLTVLDLIPLILKDLYRAHRPSWRFHFARWLELQAIRRATVCIAISECTARDLTSILGIPAERIRVTPLGVDPSFLEVFAQRIADPVSTPLRNRLGLPDERPIVLYVGGHDERKNIRALVGIVQRIVRESSGAPSEKPLLVMAGRISSPREQEVLTAALREFEMENDVVSLGYIPDTDLKALYSISSAFLFPSLYEGFGLPCLEAMAAGVPVVCSNTSSMPEVVGSAGILFDPTNIEGGARALAQVLSDSALRTKLSEAGHERASGFTWTRTGELTRDAYRYAASLLGQAGDGVHVTDNTLQSSISPRAGRDPITFTIW
jgi:glycosyltransferase involved in cell wall biosynthesis